MAGHNYFRALRSDLAEVQKLYRVNQKKVLHEVSKTAESKGDDSARTDLNEVKEGVCFALSVIWVHAMLGGKQAPSYKRFTERQAKYVQQAQYFTDENVVNLQIAYLAATRANVSSERLAPFLQRVLGPWGLVLTNAKYSVIPTGTMAGQMKSIMRDSKLDESTCEKSTGIVVSATLPALGRHAVALFRHATRRDAIFFFDANCGCYQMRAQEEVQTKFFNAWAESTKNYFGAQSLGLQSYVVVQRER